MRYGQASVTVKLVLSRRQRCERNQFKLID